MKLTITSIQGGVLVSDDSVGYFERNRIFDNRVTGVEVKNEGNPVFIDNEIYGAQASGIIVYRQGKTGMSISNLERKGGKVMTI